MAKFQIICDAGASIDKKYLDNNHIDIIGVYLIADSKRYILDGNHSEFPKNKQYDIIKEKKDFCYQNPLYLDIKNVYERYLRNGLDILAIKSSNSTYLSNDSSNLIKNELLRLYPDRKIIYVDSLCFSLGLSFILDNALESINLDLNVDEAFSKILELVNAMNQYVLLLGKKNIQISDLSILKKHHHRHNYIFSGNNGYLEYQYSFFNPLAPLKKILKEVVKNQCMEEDVLVYTADCKEKYLNIIKKYLKKHLNITVKIEPISLTLLSVLGSDAIGIVYRKKE